MLCSVPKIIVTKYYLYTNDDNDPGCITGIVLTVVNELTDTVSQPKGPKAQHLRSPGLIYM